MALTTAQIQNAYVAFFNRPADVAGLTYWSTYAGSTADLLNTFAQSAEYKSLYSGLNNTQTVNAVYQNLFGHAPDVAGLQYWVTQLDQGKLAIGNIADAINKGAQGTDATIISNKVTAATAFTTALDTTAEIVAYAGVNATGLDAVKAWLAAVTSDSATLTTATSTATLTSITNTVLNNVGGTSYSLTTGVDNLTGTGANDIFTADNTGSSKQLVAADQINGGAGTDTLKIYNASGDAIESVAFGTLSSIENLYLNNGALANTKTLDVSAQTGVTSLEIASPVAIADGATFTVKTASTQAVKLTNVNGVTGGATSTLALDGASNVVLNGVGTDLTLDLKSTGTTLNLTTATAASTATLTNTGGALATLNIAGDKALTLTNNLSTLKTIDGSTATGDLTLGGLNAATVTVKTGAGTDSLAIQATAKVAVDTGAGVDTVTLKSALAAGSTLSLGAGNDKLLINGGSVAAGASVIDGGDGTDSIAANLLNAGNAAQFKNFELVNLDSTTGFDLALLGTNNTITGLTMSTASTSGTYQNVTQAMGLTVDYVGDNSGVTNTLSMTGVTGTTDSYTITFNAAAATTAAGSVDVRAGKVVAAGIENFNIVSGGTNHWNELTLGTNTSAQKVTITGGSDLTLAFDSNFGSTTAPLTGVTTVDGSAATGKLNINLANVVPATAGLVVKGGSAADTITTNATATTLTGGAGADNFVVTSAVTGSTSAPVITTITDAAAGDKLTFSGLGTAVWTSAKVDVSTATALFGGTTNALNLAVSAAGDSHAQVKWFQYAGNTYVLVHSDAAATANNAFSTTDQVIKLTGLIDLASATFADGGATASLTLA